MKSYFWSFLLSCVDESCRNLKFELWRAFTWEHAQSLKTLTRNESLKKNKSSVGERTETDYNNNCYDFLKWQRSFVVQKFVVEHRGDGKVAPSISTHVNTHQTLHCSLTGSSSAARLGYSKATDESFICNIIYSVQSKENHYAWFIIQQRKRRRTSWVREAPVTGGPLNSSV